MTEPIATIDRSASEQGHSGINREALKLLTPSRYNGEFGRAGTRFLSQCVTYFRKAHIDDDEDKIALALGLMEGNAEEWATPYFDVIADEGTPFESWAAFVAAFKLHFCDIDDVARSMMELANLTKFGRNNRTVMEFVAKFENLALRTGISDIDKRQRLHEGLPTAVVDLLLGSGLPKKTYEELKKTALEVGQELEMKKEQERFRTRNSFWRGKSNPASASATVAASSTSRTTSSRSPPEYGTFKGNCNGCGEYGHMKFQCKNAGRGQKGSQFTVASTSTTASSTAPAPAATADLGALLKQIASMSATVGDMQKELREFRALKESEHF